MARSSRLVGSVLLCAIMLSGCASTTAIPIQSGDVTTPGIRIYDKKPILMVYNKGAGIEYIPNYNKAYALQFTAFLSKNDVKTEYENGSLKKLDSNLDSTEIIKLLTAIANGLLAPTPATPKTSAAETGAGPLRAMYEFEFSDAGDFVRLKRLDSGFPKPFPEPAAVPPPAAAGDGKDGAPKIGNRS